VREMMGKYERASASPGNIRDLMRANYQLDVRHVLPVITAPALILHRVADALVPVACGRYLAEHIPAAKFVEVPGRTTRFSTSRRRTSSLTMSKSSSLASGSAASQRGCWRP